MNEFFIQKIDIKDVMDIKDYEIPLDTNDRKHLIITGKNGCGKTSSLKEINKHLIQLLNNGFQNIKNLENHIINHTNAKNHSINNIENYLKNIDAQTDTIAQINANLKQQFHAGVILDEEVQKQQIAQLQNNISSYEQNIINENNNIHNYEQNISTWQNQLKEFLKINLHFSHPTEVYESIEKGKFILAYFEAKRGNIVNIPTTVTKQAFQPKYMTTPDLNKTFVQYMVNIHTEKMYAKDEHDDEGVKKIDTWFKNFENSLKTLFVKDDLKLRFYRKEFNFKIEYDNKSFGLNELSDGYSSILSILTELILRMDALGTKAYDIQGVILVDEIETHLHVELQKKILPFFTSFFPKLQFIVTTHSPFVLSSLSNAVICDLEKRVITQDLSAYSYESLVDSYFDIDKYSDEVKKNIARYEQLAVSDRSELKESEIIELLELKDYFSTIPKFQNEELGLEISRINKIMQINNK